MAATTQETNDFYERLGVAHDAKADDIEAAFLLLKLKHDLGYVDVTDPIDSDQSFPLARQAYDVLSNPFLRQLYDMHIIENEQKTCDEKPSVKECADDHQCQTKDQAADTYAETHAKVLQCEDLTERIEKLSTKDWNYAFYSITIHTAGQAIDMEWSFRGFQESWNFYMIDLLREHKLGTRRECTRETSDFCSSLLELHSEFSKGLAMFEQYMRTLEEATLTIDTIIADWETDVETLRKDYESSTYWYDRVSDFMDSEEGKIWQRLVGSSDDGDTVESANSQLEGGEEEA
ncbi:hypothetical protein F5Y18DRAFT_434394 [Xylariaceae sp. FL1019]|nr:hypothetical protein F5Y18DRAFT_434394 [Xylariaceae sp. FL1019]